MLSKATVLKRLLSYRALAVACLISLLLHLAVMGGLDLHMPALSKADEVVEVTLLKPVIKPRPRVTASVASIAPQARKHVPKPTPKAAEDRAEAEPPQTVVEPVVEPVAEPEPQLSTESEPIALQEENQPEQVLLGQHGSLEMDFDIRRNGDKGTAGNTHISYTQEDDGSYVLKSLSEARGFAALFFSGLVQTSAGVVTNKGLKPATFTYQYGDNVDKSRHATFDWQTAKITLQNKNGTDTADLPAGTQDMLSFMYQFRFVPPLNEMSLSVTNGRKVRVYEYGFEGEDTVQTKLGALRSLHISRHGDEGEQKAELWLAIDYQFLPVKIRITEKDGNVIEQIVTRIASSGADNTLPKP